MRGLLAALRSQIRYRIILPYVALMLLVMTAGGAIAGALVAASWEDRLTNELATAGRSTSESLVLRERDILNFLLQVSSAQANPGLNTRSVAETVADSNADETLRAVRPYYDLGNVNYGLNFDRMIVFDREGSALADFINTGELNPNIAQGLDLSNIAPVRQVLGGSVVNGNDKFAGLIIFQPDPQPYLYTVAPIKNGTATVGGVLVGTKLDPLLERVQQRTLAAITTFYDLDGAPIGSTLLRREDELPSLRMPTQALDQLRNGAAQSVFDVPVRNQTYLFAYSPLVIAGSQVGYYSVSLSRDFQINTLTFSRNAIIGLTLALALGTFIIGAFVARMITRPLYQLVDTAEAVTAGDLERRTPIGGIDEFQRLGVAFNRMTEHLLGLYRTSRDLGTTLDARAVLQTATDAAQPFAPGTTALAVLPANGDGWRLASTAGDQLLPVGHPLTLVVNQPPQFVHPVEYGLPDYATLHITPIHVQQQAAGALLLAHPDAHGIEDPLAPGLLSVINMTTSVLTNAALFTQVQRDASERSAILQSIADGLVVTDPDGTIVLMNNAAERLLNLHDWRTRRVQFDELPLEPTTVSADLFQSGATPVVHYTLNGVTISRSDAPVLGAEDAHLGSVIVLRDISTEAAVDQAKTDFIATISHELRTPLTVIHGYTDLVLRGIAGPVSEEQREMLGQVRVRAEHMGGLFKNVITVASIAADKLDTNIAPQDVKLAVEQALAPLRSTFERKGQEVRIDVPDDVPDVLADREQLGLILTQLLDNANRYTEAGPVTVRASHQGRFVRIEVTDSGPGIASEEVSKLFKRFQRIEGNSNPVRGIGLGLAIARQLVERLGGKITAVSDPARGSTFSFTLPAAERKRS